MRSASARPGSASASETAPAASPLPWPTVGLAFASMFFLMGTRSSFAVVYPAIVADVGWTISEVTGAYSVGLFVYALIAIPAGLAVDRLGCRAMLVGGTFLVTAGLVGVATASEIWHLYLAFMLMAGLGSAGIGFITLVKMISMRAGPRFATAFGLAFMGQGFGSLLVSPAIQALVDAVGWRASTLVYAGVLATVLIPLALILAPGPERHATGRDADGAFAIPGILSATFAVLFAANAGLGFQMLIPTHQVAYLLDLGFGATFAASAAGAWGALMSLGSVGGGWIVDRWGVTRVLVVSLVLIAVGTGALVMSGPALLVLVVVYVLANGLGRGLIGVTLGAVQTRAFAGPRLGRMTGVLDVAFGSGAFLGPWGTAVVHDAAGTFAPGFLATVAASMLVAVATAIAARRGRA